MSEARRSERRRAEASGGERSGGGQFLRCGDISTVRSFARTHSLPTPNPLRSMSDMKYNAIVNTGIKIENRIEIPKELVPEDAQVEITAKVFHGYNAGETYANVDAEDMKNTKGREYNY